MKRRRTWLTSCARRCCTFKQKLHQVLFKTTLAVCVLLPYRLPRVFHSKITGMRQAPPGFPVGEVRTRCCMLVCMLVCLFVRLSRRRRTRSSDANVARVGAAEHNRRTDTVQFKIGQANPPSPPGTPPGVMPPKLADRLKRMGSSSHSSFSKLPIHGEDPDL